LASIDVLLPVRNGMPFLQEAIDSVRRQTVRDWRLLVLDHGSTDGSLELARRMAEADKRISVFSHPEVEGLAALRNIGLEKCDCRYVMLQDADDISVPNRMEVVARAFDAAPGLVAIGSEAIEVDHTGARIGRLRRPGSSKAVTAASLFYFPMLHPTVSMDFRALKRLGAAYGRDILHAVPDADSIMVEHLAEDYILLGQMALLGLCANIRAPLVRYRRHPQSVGIANPMAQIETALRISRFLAESFCVLHGSAPFDPGPFCNHADYVFDFHRQDYSAEFAQMADTLRHGLGPSPELERELAFRKILAGRNSWQTALRYLQFRLRNSSWPQERRTVRNWLLRDVRHGRYIYHPTEPAIRTAS
jgi:glycosyltransferase involved in cell wall biosynthesis